MHLAIAALYAKPRTVSFVLADDWAREATEVALEGVLEHLVGDWTLQLDGVCVEVKGSLAFAGTGHCDRCYESVRIEESLQVHLAYLPEGHSGKDPELSSDQLDVGWYRNKSIILDDVLSEAIALALPSRRVCNDAGACDERMGAMLQAAHQTNSTAHDL
ncbi:MAG: hypothetical protein HN348_06315 [Proteobacteria bacterium]|nr:hypothetical protein [Pseudomonadota bacterium]